MSFRLNSNSAHFSCTTDVLRSLLGVVLIVVLGACTSPAAREAELAAEEAARVVVKQEARVVVEQEAARVAQEQAQERAAEEQRQREAQLAERARLQAERERQAAQTLARAEEENRQREEAERREQERLAVIADAEAERQGKLDRISELERQIVAIQTATGDNELAAEILQEAILVAEELLDVLTAEQAKYEDTDETGNTIEPLEKDLIAELEARKDDLIRQASSQ